MKRRVLSTMMVLSLAAACLTGCSDKKTETEAPAATEAAATEAVTEAAATEAEATEAAETEAAETEAVETEAETEAKETEAVTEAAETEAAETEAAEVNATVPAGVVKIGLFEPLTGQNGGGGVQEAQGAWYANEVRPTVTIDGDVYTVELVEVDNKSDKTEAVTAAQKLVADGVAAVIGSYGSGVSIAAGPIFADANIPAVGCSCTNPQVTSGCEYYFRVCFLDPFQGSVMAKYAIEQGYQSVAVIEELGDDYSTGIANYFIKAFTELGGTIVGDKAQDFQTNQSDFKAILTQVKDADAIFAPSSITTASLIIKQARELGIEAPIMGPDTWFNVAVIENAGDSAEGTVASTFFAEDDTTIEGLDEFVTGYKAWMNEDSSRIDKNGGNDDVVGNSALCYDTYMVICDALEAAGTTDGEALKEAIAATDYNGATGHIVFDEIGDAARDCVTVVVAKDGKFQFLEKVMAD